MAVGAVLARRGGPWLARRIAAADDEELARVLRSRAAAGVLLWGVFRAMPHRVRPGAELRAEVEWRVRRDGDRVLVRRLRIADGAAQVLRPGPSEPPADLVLTLDDASFLRLAAGQRSVTWLVLRGRLSVEGSKVLAARLLFALDPAVPSSPDAGRRRGDRSRRDRGAAGPRDRDAP